MARRGLERLHASPGVADLSFTLTFVDNVLPRFDVESQHEIIIDAEPETVYQAARDFDASSSALIRFLFTLRGLPATALNAEGLQRLGFKTILEEPPRAFALGVVGQFWKPTGMLLDFDAGRFGELHVAGYAKALWSFEVVPRPRGETVLRTVTRVACGDRRSRRLFMAYWRLVGPFSGMVRRSLLSGVKKSVEDRRA